MSDSLRKDFSTKAQEAVKPQDQKSGFEKAKESVTDSVDKASGDAQKATDDKSFTQKVGDKISSAMGK